MSKPFVALMQPSAGYGAPYKKAVKAFLRPSASVDRVEFEQGTTSTPRTFNLLLCDALNAKMDRPFTAVAMIHDDVAPDGFWLDTLLAELERTGAFMVSAVVPIRSNHGLVSTAVDMGDPWLVRRLTMHEVFKLPETFSAEDVLWNKHGGALLANTGCWVARFDREFWEAFADGSRSADGQSGFRFINRIVRHPDGQFASQDIAEDWHLSREMHALGRKVLVTRIPLEHGHPNYHTRSPWGAWPTDLGYLQYRRALSGEPLVDGWRFPEDVRGWLSEAEGAALSSLAAGKMVLEIGSYCGRSTICLAQKAECVHAVDTFDGRATTEPRETLAEMIDNLVRYGVMERVTVYRGESREAVPQIETRVDLAFIDGNHSYQSVLQDARLAMAKLVPGGLLSFHDYNRPGDEGVTAAVNALIAGGAELLDVAESVAVLKPAAV